MGWSNWPIVIWEFGDRKTIEALGQMVPTKDGYMKDMGEESQETYSIFHQNHGRLEPGMWIYGMIIGVLLMAEYIHWKGDRLNDLDMHPK